MIFSTIKPLVKLCLLVIIAGGMAHGAIAQEAGRSYSYETIDYWISINQNSTFDVEETQTYNFIGEYHQAERYIPYNKIDAISDIRIIDAGTGMPLEYSSKKLDKTDSTSWGKYTTYNNNGAKYIEWYYSAANIQKTWIIKYKVHGGISFLKDHDELYWNLFDEYTVPIANIRAMISLPENELSRQTVNQASLYTQGADRESYRVLNDRQFEFSASGIQPGGIVTIAAGWPKGIVSQAAYWKDLATIYWGMIVAVLLLIALIIFRIVFWYFAKYRPLHDRTIVPEYEPPQGLEPAQAEVVYRNRVSGKTWAATTVDLAVRGYVKISEDEDALWAKLSRSGSVLKFLGSFAGKDYIIERTAKDNSDLEDYEKTFLAIVVGTEGGIFSTRKLKRSSNSIKQAFVKEMSKLKKNLYAETAGDTLGFHVSPKGYMSIFSGLILFAVLISYSVSGITDASIRQLFALDSQLIIAGIGFLIFAIIIVYTLNFSPRLNHRGNELKRHLLGFRLYLETAERYRLQNLTPDLFEKYLPFAMIFGIEKKWAKAFETMNLQAPTWYHGTSYAGYSGGSGGFSASTFSASFSSSFASAFSSSTGTGGAGGGGAGGGGGGGGGGAS